MALETLVLAQREAANILGAPYDELADMQRPEVHALGNIVLAGVEPFPVYRVHTGPEGLIGKGGTRMFDYGSPEAAIGGATELSAEMWPKIWVRSQDYAQRWRGGKTVMLVDSNMLSPGQKQEAAIQYADLMGDAGLANAMVSVPAGDIGFNGLADIYAKRVYQRDEDYQFWQATITGKSPEMGGLAFRTNATGYGVYVSLRTLQEKGKGDDVIDITTQGCGNVGAWFMYYAGLDSRMRVSAFSEREGMLSTKHPDGIIITEDMVQQVGDNPKFQGNKLLALATMIEANQPGIELEYSNKPDDILEYPTDYFVPAVAPNVINERNMGRLGARIGIGEAANGPTTAIAHKFLVNKGLVVVPDFIINGAGVDGSIIEWQANVNQAALDELPPDDGAVKQQLTSSTSSLTERTIEAALAMHTRDYRVAGSGLFIAQLFPNQGLRLAA